MVFILLILTMKKLYNIHKTHYERLRTIKTTHD